jgi:hypothetical protein
MSASEPEERLNAVAEEHEIPVLLKTPKAPDGSLLGINRFATVFQRAFGAIRNHPYVVFGLALVASVTKAVGMWAEQQQATNALNQSLINQGIYTRELSQQYQDMALAVQQSTTYSDEEVLKAQGSMQAYLKGQTISRELMLAVVDFAAAKQMPLERAAELIGKSIGTSMNALTRYGIALDEAATPAERAAAVIASVNSKWGGQAAAATQGLGSMKQMQNALRTIMEVAGRTFEPFVTMIAQSISDFARKLEENPRFLDSLEQFAKGFEVGIVIIRTTVATVLQSIPVIVRSRMGAAMEAATGNFSKATQTWADGDAKLHQIAKEQKLSSQKARAAVFADSVDKRNSVHDARLAALQAQVNERKRQQGDTQQRLNAMFKARTEKEILEDRTRQILRTDEAFKAVNRNLLFEKDKTERLKLELQKRKLKEEATRKAQMSFAEKNTIIGAISDKESLALHRPVLEQLADARNSKFGAQILIGKAASVAQIALNTTLAIAGATEALLAIPPPVGEALAAATGQFLAMYGAEQIENIIGSSIDNPGRIGGLPFSMEAILESVWGYMGRQYQQIGYLIEQLYGFSGNLISDATQAIDDFLSDNLGIAGSVIGGVVGAYGDVYGTIYNAIGDLYGFVYGTIGSVLADAAEFIAGAVADTISAIGNAIGDAAESLFGWLFAEGGVVTHTPTGLQPQVTSLKDSGLQLHRTVNVTIMGGLVPSPQEARRLATLIAQELRK